MRALVQLGALTLASLLGSAVGTIGAMRLADRIAEEDFVRDMSLPPCSRAPSPYLCASALPPWERHPGPAFPRCLRALGVESEASWQFCARALPMWQRAPAPAWGLR